MNQVALSTLIIRLFGLYLLYQIISYFFGGILLPQIWVFFNDDVGGTTGVAIAGLLTLAIMIVFCGFTILKANWFSRLLFKENEVIIGEGRIDTDNLLALGLKLLGVYILLVNTPYAIPAIYDWIKFKAQNTQMQLNENSESNLLFIQYVITFILGVALALKGKSVSVFLMKRG